MKNLVASVLGLALSAACWAGEPADIGDAVSLPALADLSGKPVALDSYGEHPAYVLYFFGNTCPVAQRYTGVMVSLADTALNEKVQFLAINVNEVDTPEETAAFAEEYGIDFPVLKDIGTAAKALGVTRTPQVVVLDREKKLRYRGRVDDQFRLGGVRPAPSREDLRIALEEILAGKEVSVPETKAEGCLITFPESLNEKKSAEL